MNMVRIGFSVGEKGKNLRSDVLAIQKAINCVIKCNLLTPLIPLKEDGVVGKNTKTAIRRFQQNSLRIPMPDGRIDPGGKTLEKLNAIISTSKKQSADSVFESKITQFKLPNAVLAEKYHQSSNDRFSLLVEKSPKNLSSADLDLIAITKEGFVKKVHEAAIREALISGVPAAITTAQAILETGYGKSIPIDIHTKKYSYNLFGIKGVGTAGSVEIYTHEVIKGERIRIIDKFQAYHSFSESITGRTTFLKKNIRYKFLFNTDDPKKWAEGLQKAGYATDPNYAKTLISIMNSWKLI